MKNDTIKNILFDLGGVIINLEPYRTHAAFEGILGQELSLEKMAALSNAGFFDQYEIGAISSSDFINALMQDVPNHVETKQMEEAWSAMLLDFPKDRLALLSTLREEGYRLFLFSNTNELHLRDFMDIYHAEHPELPPFNSFFEIPYYSHLIGKRKPNKEAFEWLLKDAGINAHETLFIDDNAANIAAAEKLGIKVRLHDANTHLETSLRKAL